MNVEVSRIDIGLALLISNDYVGSTSQELKFTHKDSDGLKQVFENDFMYKVYQNKNTSKKKFLSCCKFVAEYKYPKTCKRIVVYFSGHGKDGSVLQLQDGEYVSIDDMISLFKPDIANNNSLVGIVKLFFIDACRGRGEEAGCLISKGAVAVKYPTVSSEANIFVAYASPPSYMSYGGSKGSRWTKCLIEAFKKSKVEDSVYDILTATHIMMSEKSGRHQTPEFTSRLTDVVYFKKEAAERQKERKKQSTTSDLRERSTVSRGAEGFGRLQGNDNLTGDAFTNFLQERGNPLFSGTGNLPRKRKNPLEAVGTSSDLDWLSGGNNSSSKRNTPSGLDSLSGGSTSTLQRSTTGDLSLALLSPTLNRDIRSSNFLLQNSQTPLLQGTSNNLSWLQGGSSSTLQRDTPQRNHNPTSISGTSGTPRSDLLTSISGAGGIPINNVTNTEQFQHCRRLGNATSTFRNPRLPQQRGGVRWMGRTIFPDKRYY